MGVVLTDSYDLSCVADEDKSSVLATISCVVSLEERMPKLEIVVRRENGYYAIVVRNLNQYIDLEKWHSKVTIISLLVASVRTA